MNAIPGADEKRLIEAARNHIMTRWLYTRSLATIGQIAGGDIKALDKAHERRRFYEHRMNQAQDEYCAAFTALEDNMTEVMELPTP